jgi:hypothetical protein
MAAELLIIAALAVYRITLLFSREKGVGDMFGWIRYKLGVRFDENSQEISTGWLSEAILCPYCFSVWVGIVTTGFILVCHTLNADNIALIVLLPFAFSGISVFLFKLTGV